MNILGLFDGMSCLQIALIESGIKFDKYYSSEVDKFAIQQTQHNFTNTIQLGDVTKWQEWDIDWSKIGLIGAGSPCQGFSFAGKQLAFSDPRSKLFFVFIDILNHAKKYNPNVLFLLENVDMKKEYLRIISEYCGVFPININSNLVSAQNRNRWYWSNIKIKKVGLFDELYTDIPQPKDKGILLRDILDKEVDEKYFITQKSIERIQRNNWNIGGDKAQACLSRDYKGIGNQQMTLVKIDKDGKVKPNQDKASCFTTGAHSGGNHSDMDLICVAMVGRKLDENGTRKDNSNIKSVQQLEPQLNGKTNCLSTVSKDNLLTNGYRIRRLTPNECAKLQTIPPWYKWIVSDSQIYRILGNGWTVKVISHILNQIK